MRFYLLSVLVLLGSCTTTKYAETHSTLICAGYCKLTLSKELVTSISAELKSEPEPEVSE